MLMSPEEAAVRLLSFSEAARRRLLEALAPDVLTSSSGDGRPSIAPVSRLVPSDAAFVPHAQGGPRCARPRSKEQPRRGCSLPGLLDCLDCAGTVREPP